jgi:C1A family cysteine protease
MMRDSALDGAAAVVVAPEATIERPGAYGTGWIRDWPDVRDYTAETPTVKAILKDLGIAKAQVKAPALPATVDLRGYFSPVENQGQLGACTAHAAVGVLEYSERRAFNNYVDGSRLFLYKVTRDLLGWTGDTGAFLRSAMGAMALFGVPPEKYWPYDITKFDVEPSAFLYGLGQSFQAVTYFRLDPPGTPRPDLLAKIKTNLGAGLPSIFGFTVYNSISQAQTTGRIPLPAPGEKVLGGHAVSVAGYQDDLVIKNATNGAQTKGAFLIRNSWGTGWGELGYGWLPYDYVLKGIATDWWVLSKAEWVATGQFGL